MSAASPETFAIAQTAFQAFTSGLADGDWAPFLEQLSDDFTFWFPAGPFQGWNQGRERLQMLLESIPRVFPGGLTLTVQQVTSNASTVVFEVRSEGLMLGHPYQNQAAIAFKVKDHQVCSYREYLGAIFQLPPK